jgi:hypothetical protein
MPEDRTASDQRASTFTGGPSSAIARLASSPAATVAYSPEWTRPGHRHSAPLLQRPQRPGSWAVTSAADNTFSSEPWIPMRGPAAMVTESALEKARPDAQMPRCPPMAPSVDCAGSVPAHVLLRGSRVSDPIH